MKNRLFFLFLFLSYVVSSFSQHYREPQREAQGFFFHDQKGGFKYADVYVPNSPFIVTHLEFNGEIDRPEYEEFRQNLRMLDSVSISEQDPDFSSENGVMYDKNKTTLKFCPQAKQGRLIIPQSVREIEYCAFYKCRNLTAVVLNDSIHFKTLDEFYLSLSFSLSECQPLPPIEVSENNPYYTQQEGVLYNKNKTQIIYHYNTDCSKRINWNQVIHIPHTVKEIKDQDFKRFRATIKQAKSNSIKQIGREAFAHSGIDTLFLDSVIRIGWRAFIDCYDLKSVIITSDSLKRIPGSAFAYCSSLESVTIPKSVTEIEQEAFEKCICLKEITVAWNTPLELKKEDNVFAGVRLSRCTLRVPKGTRKAYKKAPVWKNFGHIVEEE